MTDAHIPVAISALANVPAPRTPAGRNAARNRAGRNMEAVLATGAHCGVITETWQPFLKNGIRAAAPPSIRFHTLPGQSVMTWWDDEILYGEPLAPFVLHGALWTQWDERKAMPVRLFDRNTGRSGTLAGEHDAPLKHRLPFVYRVGLRAHASTITATEHFANLHPYRPIFVAGDLNESTKLFPSAHATVGTHIGNGIVHGELFHGRRAQIFAGPASGFALESDHEGVLTTLTIRRVAR